MKFYLLGFFNSVYCETAMLLQQKKEKRHSFSIDSLAISSRVEDTERDTASPYLDYLQGKNAVVDINSNESTRQWILEQNVAGINYPQQKTDSPDPQATSTPIQNNSIR